VLPVIKRKPLAATARRAGWVGCNFALNRIPAEARIAVVTTVKRLQSGTGILPVSVSETDTTLTHHRLEACATLIIAPEEVREKFRRVKPLKDISVTQRGWTLDVLNIVRRLVSEGRAPRDPNSGKMGRRRTPPSDSFNTADAYAFTRELEKLHPDN
jgi:type II restriction enzyme